MRSLPSLTAPAQEGARYRIMILRQTDARGARLRAG